MNAQSQTTEARFRATPQQEWLWRHAPADRSSFWSVRSIALPAIDVARLTRAFATLQSEYEVLRSSLVETQTGQLAQSIASSPRNLVMTIDEAQPQALPDPLECAAVLILSRTDEGYDLRLATSQLLLDSQSAGMLVSKLHAAYTSPEQASAGTRVLQYADYAPWAHEQVAAERRHAFAATVPDAHLSIAHGNDGTARVMSFEVLRLLTESVDRGAGTSTAEAWYFTAFAILVRRLSRQESFAVSAVVPGRTEAELLDNLGLYEMPVRLAPACEGTHSFKSALLTNTEQLQRASEQAYEMFDPSSARAGACFAFTAFKDDGWNIKSIQEPLIGCEIGLRISQTGHSVRAHWTFDANKFTADAVRALHDGFVALLAGAVADPDSNISWFRMVELADQHRYVLRGSATPAATTRLVDAIFTADRTDLPALSMNGKTLSFAQLDLWSRRLAGLLVDDYGVAEGDTVALMMGRSIEWVVSALAVMRIGACYAPIEVQAPPLRIRSILTDMQPKLLVAGDAIADTPVSTLQFGSKCWEQLEQRAPGSTSVAVAPQRAAYCLQTSGSSGKPKGVRVSEGSLLNYVSWAANHYRVDEIDSAVLHTSLAVDLTITSLWVPLFAGKPVEILDQQGSVPALLRLIGEERRWLLKLTPTHLRGLVQCSRLTGVPIVPTRGVLVVGGELLTYADLQPWQRADTDLRIYNEYGPTETTVGSTCAQVTPGGEGAVSIGKPIDNTFAWAVDMDGQLLPTELAGELVIGGAGVALGYTGDAQGNESRFFTAGPSQTPAYRTGDRVVLRSDGSIDYLGRTDEQIKLRGFRIEPKEVEAVLLATDKLEALVVTKIVHERQGENLVAFCVAKPGVSFDAEALREHARKHLPGYMVPGAFVKVDRIPMTSGGKRNLSALLEQTPVRAITHAQYSPPRSHVEQVLASVWSYVLGVEQVGLDDDYFALGGDSLRSVQITALAEKRHVRFSVAALHRHPTVRTLAAHIAECAEPEQAVHLTRPFELLSEQDRQKLPKDVVDAYPLNLLQEGMIYHREFRPKSAVYHAICSYTIDAPFDRALMSRAVCDLIDRHPLLRTSFDLTTYSRPLQLVHAPKGGELHFLDVSDQPGPLQQIAVDQWMDAEKIRGFEIEEYPLIRFMAHRFSDTQFQLTYSFHHEIIDGWSDAWMVTELMNHYMAMVNGEVPEVAAPTATFRDSIFLEQQALANKDFEAFWHRYLADVTVMKLPTYRAAKADKGEREIVKFEVPISDELSKQVQALARNLAVPLKTVLLAAHMRVMSKIGGVDDVLTYIVSNGRPENRDGHSIIGLFVNSLAFRMDLSGGSWADLVYGVLETEQKTLPYRRFPMAELKRQHGSEPLSETLFFFNNYHVAESLQRWKNLRLAGLKVYAESTFPFCVNAFVEPFVGKIHMRIEYDRLQYTAALMDDISDLYGAVLREMVDDIHGRYEAVELLTPEKNRALLEAATGPKYARESGQTVLDLINAAAQRDPNRAAIRSGERQITYAALMRKSDDVAQFLLGRGIQPGQVVALRMEREPEAIIAALGAMKAGITYIPLDGSVPIDRLRYILGSCRAQLVIGDREIDGALDVPVVAYTEAAATRVESALALPRVTQGGAYVIFTSGSTGNPKGIECDHAGLLNSVLARVDYYGHSPESFLMLSPHSFDSSVAGIYWTLCGGGTLVLPAPTAQIDPLEICRTLVDRGITHLLCIPSLYAAILDELESLIDIGTPKRSLVVTTCIVAGEACPSELQARHVHLLPEASLYNEYGPTEATVWSTVHRCDDAANRATLSIGRAIANTTAYVLDSTLRPALPGVQGELWLGGAGIAHGYVSDPARTAERFIPDPYAERPGARLYRTGDLCRVGSNGLIEFLGRTDGMIKVQGFRVELAEIERVLERHESVKRAVLHAQTSAQGTQLIAYVVPSSRELDVEQLRDFARKSLPKYMIPSLFVVIEAVPVKSSGKVDYGALPVPKRAAAPEATQPRTSTEKLVHGIWQSVLGVGELGIYDDFFELGGESLRALRIIARVRRALGCNVPLGTLMSSTPTVAGMAEFLDQQLRVDQESVA